MAIPFPCIPIRFDRHAAVIAPGDGCWRLLLRDPARRPGDLIVISHGWNNTRAEAENLYSDLLGHAAQLLREGLLPGLAGRRLAVLAVYWPSKRFAPPDRGGGNAAGAGDRLDRESLGQLIQALGGCFDSPAEAATLEAMAGLLPRLKNSDSACEGFVTLARSLVTAGRPDPEEGSDRFFNDPPLRLFQTLSTPLAAAATPMGNLGAGAAGQAAAAGPGHLFGGIGSAARAVLNLTTYYAMKERAGLIGSTGLNPLLRAIVRACPTLRLHLVGHSFGGRLMSATAAGISDATVLQAHSMSLLQAAFSHYGFARNWDGHNSNGSFRRVVDRQAIQGPILITHTNRDTAVGMAYPLASLLAGQNASALGDSGSPYGGIGRNGAQKTPEALQERLLPAGGSYGFLPGRLHNLNARNDAGDLIRHHGDVGNRHVAHAVLSAIAAAAP